MHTFYLMRYLAYILAVLLTEWIHCYDGTLGVNLCRLTVASYCKPSDVAKWQCGPCLNSPIHLSSVHQFYNKTGDTVGLIGVAESPKALVLVFRGTVPWDIKNWISDINFLKTKFKYCNNNCEVHRGFWEAYQQISAQVLSTTEAYIKQYGIRTILIAGHSLGGALATHGAIDLVANGFPVSKLYTYGSPRVGDDKFSVWFSSFFSGESSRVTHGRDPVPHLAPHDFGFSHIVHEIFYKGSVKNGFVSCEDSASKEDPKCCNQFLADVMVTDHLSYFDIDFAGIILHCQ